MTAAAPVTRVLMVTGAYYPEISSGGAQCRDMAQQLRGRARAFRRMAIDLVRLVRRSDIIHLHGYSTKNVLVTVAAKIFRKPIVMSLHTSGYDEPAAIERQGSLALWSFLSADLYLSVSPGLVDSYLAAGLPVERILLVPNGIDIVRFAPATADEQAALRTRLSLPVDRPVIVFVGFLSADKQPHRRPYAGVSYSLSGVKPA